jgi:hypothetical protein
MTVSVAVLIPSKTAESTQTTQYTSTNVTTIIDKFTAVNYSLTAATISVNLVVFGGAAGNSNLVTKQRTLQPSEAYTFPEIVGHALSSGSFISTIASAASSITIRASGRLVT